MLAADTYPDSSFVVSLHRHDANRAAARAYMARSSEPIIFTALHRIECRNAFRNLVAVGELTGHDCRTAFRELDEDLRDEILIHTEIRWTNVFRRAEDLSAAQATAAGQRTLDLLHVAIAIECGARIFLSFDARQRRLASAAGLAVRP